MGRTGGVARTMIIAAPGAGDPTVDVLEYAKCVNTNSTSTCCRDFNGPLLAGGDNAVTTDTIVGVAANSTVIAHSGGAHIMYGEEDVNQCKLQIIIGGVVAAESPNMNGRNCSTYPFGMVGSRDGLSGNIVITGNVHNYGGNMTTNWATVGCGIGGGSVKVA